MRVFTKRNLSKFPGKNIDAILVGLCEMADGLVMVLSLGFYNNSNLGMKYLCWRTDRVYQNRDRA